jgi:hypothetical protein
LRRAADFLNSFSFLQLIRTTIQTRHSREPRPDDDLGAEKMLDSVKGNEYEAKEAEEAGNSVEMEPLTAEGDDSRQNVKETDSTSFKERLNGKCN